jgi:hypothetical protein
VGADGKDQSYSELGKLLYSLACTRGVRGPYSVAGYLEKSLGGHVVSGQAVSKYLVGAYLPKHSFIEAFADAFELSAQERAELAWVYTYGSSNGHIRDRARDDRQVLP